MIRNVLLLTLPAALLSVVACDVDPIEPIDAADPFEEIEASDRAELLDYGLCQTDDANYCGGQSAHPDGCWCDDACEQYGDCCFDKQTSCDGVVTCLNDDACGDGQTCNTDVCIPACPPGVVCILGCFGACEDAAPDPNSCEGNCDGQAPGGCWCDDACVGYGDCCDDVDTACAEPEPEPEPDPNSCEGNCDGQAPGGCWCDDACVGYGDCCEDVNLACADDPCAACGPDETCGCVNECPESVDGEPVACPAICELGCVPNEPEPTCDDVVADLYAEREAISSCTSDAECGQGLPGTSCGCTQNWVARTDANTDDFYALLDSANEMGCDWGGISICSCPPVDGFVCNEGMCAWNYTTGGGLE